MTTYAALYLTEDCSLIIRKEDNTDAWYEHLRTHELKIAKEVAGFLNQSQLR